MGKNDDPGRYCVDRSPEQVVAAAKAAGCRTISYTYVEPTIFFEFAYDCCMLAAENNIGNIFVSNGYMSEQTTRLLAPVLTGINIDIKSFRDEFYKSVCGARLQPVLDSRITSYNVCYTKLLRVNDSSRGTAAVIAGSFCMAW